MIEVILALALTTACGFSLARLLGASPFLSFFFGTGAVWAVLFVMPWQRLTTAGTLVALTVLPLLASRHRERNPQRTDLSPIDIGTAAVIAGFTGFATLTALWEWDAWAIWALKGRVFFENGGIDWHFLQDETNFFAHPDYPLLVPHNLALPAVLSGTWNDRWLGLTSAAFAAAAALVARQATRTEGNHVSATVALVVAALCASPYVGTAETPLIALGTCALLLLRQRNVFSAAILLGLAANTKNEGLTLLAAAAAGLAASGRRGDIVRLWPAALLAAPWQVARVAYGLESYFGSPASLDAIASRAWNALSLARFAGQHTTLPLLFVVVLISIPLVARRERLLLTAAGVQLMFFTVAYLVTPFDPEWQIENSWDRLSRQLLTIACTAVALGIAPHGGAMVGGESHPSGPAPAPTLSGRSS